MTIEKAHSVKLNNLMQDMATAGYTCEVLQEVSRTMPHTFAGARHYHVSVYAREQMGVDGKYVHPTLRPSDFKHIEKLAKKRRLLTFSDERSQHLEGYHTYYAQMDRNECGLVFVDQHILTDTRRTLVNAARLMAESPHFLKGDAWYEAAWLSTTAFTVFLERTAKQPLFAENDTLKRTSYGDLWYETRSAEEARDACAKTARFHGVNDAGISLYLETMGVFCRII